MKTKYSGNAAMIGSLILLAGAPVVARATLSYESIGGVGLIYDSVENITWTQDGDISGSTFDFQDAQTWAASLDLAGIGAGEWQLPDAAQLTSMFAQLDGTDHKYGSQVFFGPGPNDYAGNVETVYWTDTDSTDFNFYYGYPGYATDDTLYSAWAVTAVPEPSPLAFGVLAAGLVALRRGRVSLR